MPRKSATTRKSSSVTSNAANEATLEIDGQRVKCTRLSKILYPEARFTKGEVIEYYVRVAPFILPHLKDRPVTLKRYPNGVTGQAYWDKNALSFTPEWVETFPVPRRGGAPDINYVLVQNAATLAWTANAAALELHPFLHRAPAIRMPTSIVFDLDPGRGADILQCIEVAFLIKGVIEQFGLKLFAKVSGSKGIQLYLPLNTRSSYEITQPFARSIAQLIETQNPNLAVSEMPKEKRVGKVFIDWSQNTDYKTTVGVYSLRAKQERPFVSMPVTWDELHRARKRTTAEELYFDPKAALARLEKVGDLFSPVADLKQSLPPDLAQVIDQENKREGRTRKGLRQSDIEARAATIERSELDKLPRAQAAFIEPMLAKLVGKLPEGGEWEYEAKFDGYRVLVLKDTGVTVLSRRGNNLTDQFPMLSAACANLPDGTVLDGEIVALDENGQPSFNALQNRRSHKTAIQFYGFDLLTYFGHTLMSLPLEKRREWLKAALVHTTDPVRFSATLHANVDALVAAAKQTGLEGIVAKRRDSRYEPGKRSGAWIKFKLNQDQELVIGGYVPAKRGFDSLLAGYYQRRQTDLLRQGTKRIQRNRKQRASLRQI